MGRHLPEVTDIVVGGQDFGRNDPPGGDLGRVLPQGHVGQVEQPAKPQMPRVIRQELEQDSDGSPGAPLQAMPAGFPHRKKTGVFSVGGNAVLLLPQPQIGHRQQVPDHGGGLPRQLPRLPPDPGLHLGQLPDGSLALPAPQKLQRHLQPQAHLLTRVLNGSQALAQMRDRPGIHGVIREKIGVAGQLRQPGGHAPGAGPGLSPQIA